MISSGPLIAVMLLSIFISVTTALLAWRERPEPGAVPLTALLVGGSWWTVFFVFELQATTLGGKILWSNLQWIGVVIVPVAWLLFALEYTGRDRLIQFRSVALLSVVPMVTILLALTEGYHSLLYVESTIVTEGGVEVLHRRAGPWFWVVAGYTYFLGILGMIPLLSLVRSNALPFRGQSLALLIGATVPWAASLLYIVGASPLPGVDPTPIGFAVSGLALLGAIRRYRLLEISPAPNWSARHLVFERMHEGAVVVDNHGYVVDMNDNAVEIVADDPSDILGRPARDVIPGYEDFPEDGQASDHVTISRDDGTYFFDVTVTRIDDFHGRTIGRVITFHDVGEHLQQKQRLEVLNRVLRHNIRTETNLITGYAEVLDDADGWAAMIKEHANAINELGEKAREIADMFEREGEPAEATSLDGLLSRAVRTVRSEHPNVTFDYESPSDDVQVARVLASVFSNVLENAAQHNTNPEPRVDVRVDRDDDTVWVSVADNGPGIHKSERSVLERGRETALEHGSGLGLWLIMWGSTIAGGEVTFSKNDPSGSIVSVEVPVLSQSADAPVERDKIAS